MTVQTATTATIQIGTAWTGTAPGPGVTVSSISGTINTGSGTYIDATGLCQAVDVPMTTDMEDGTTFASKGFKVQYPGLKGAQVALTMLNDFEDNGLDEKLYGLWAAGTQCYYYVKPTDSAVGAGNPAYVGAFHVNEWKPIQVPVGKLVVMQYAFPVNGSFTRLVA